MTTEKIDYAKVSYELLHCFIILKHEDINGITLNDLKRAYRHFSKILHPDMNKSDLESNEKFIGLKKAYELLKKKYFPISYTDEYIKDLWEKATKGVDIKNDKM